MWELDHKEGWVPKNWCFWTVVLEKTLGSPSDNKDSNQSILKEINPEYSLEGLMLKLKHQNFGHLIHRADSLEKTLILRKIEARKRKGWQKMTWLYGITNSMNMNLGRRTEVWPERCRLAWDKGSSLTLRAQDIGRFIITNSRETGQLWGFPSGSVGKESACNAGDPGSVPGLGRSPGEGNGNPLQYSCLVNSMDRGAWWATVHGVAKSQTQLSS